MDVFTQGKKVSEINLVINEDDEEKQAVKIDPMAHLLGSAESAPATPYKLMSDVKSEPIYDEFLQYVSMCGPLNLRLVAADKWHSFK